MFKTTLHDRGAWHYYFQRNATKMDPIDWSSFEMISPTEHDRIRHSISQFQLGEHSEGKHLMGAAIRYAEQHAHDELPEITRYFIREEQNHARLLGKFMDLAMIPKRTQDWTDTVFRSIRRLACYELTLSVLTVAETISLAYYDALYHQSRSAVLKQVCEKLLADEMFHLKFESEMMTRMRPHRTLRAWLKYAAHEGLLWVTIAVVWMKHRRVLSAGGYHFRRFLTINLANFRLYFGLRATRTTMLPVRMNFELKRLTVG